MCSIFWFSKWKAQGYRLHVIKLNSKKTTHEETAREHFVFVFVIYKRKFAQTTCIHGHLIKAHRINQLMSVCKFGVFLFNLRLACPFFVFAKCAFSRCHLAYYFTLIIVVRWHFFAFLFSTAIFDYILFMFYLMASVALVYIFRKCDFNIARILHSKNHIWTLINWVKKSIWPTPSALGKKSR